jgi:hypothetical protein
VAQRGAVEERMRSSATGGDCDHGKRVGRMLVAVGRERRECLEFTGSLEPSPDVSAVFAPPRFDRPRDVRAPHERERQHQEIQVLLPVVQLDELMQRPNRARRGDPLSRQRTVKRHEARRRELLWLQLRQQVTEDVEIVCGAVGTMERAVDPLHLRPGERRLHDERNQERTLDVGREPPDEASDDDDGDRGRDPSEPRG